MRKTASTATNAHGRSIPDLGALVNEQAPSRTQHGRGLKLRPPGAGATACEDARPNPNPHTVRRSRHAEKLATQDRHIWRAPPTIPSPRRDL